MPGYCNVTNRDRDDCTHCFPPAPKGAPGWLIGAAKRAHQWAMGIETDPKRAPDLRRLARDLRMSLHVALEQHGARDAKENLEGLIEEAEQLRDGWDLHDFPRG